MSDDFEAWEQELLVCHRCGGPLEPGTTGYWVIAVDPRESGRYCSACMRDAVPMAMSIYWEER